MILINGGSSVAMLAFIGTMASKSLLSTEQLGQISEPLICFASGLVAAMIATAASYFTNLMIASNSSRKQREYEIPFLRSTPASKRYGVAGEIFRYVSVLSLMTDCSSTAMLRCPVSTVAAIMVSFCTAALFCAITAAVGL